MGCLVHSIFNFAIPRPADLECSKPWIGSRLAIGEDVSFRVNSMDFSSRLPYIRGELIENGYFIYMKNKLNLPIRFYALIEVGGGGKDILLPMRYLIGK